jgi:hypothetical protein
MFRRNGPVQLRADHQGGKIEASQQIDVILAVPHRHQPADQAAGVGRLHPLPHHGNQIRPGGRNILGKENPLEGLRHRFRASRRDLPGQGGSPHPTGLVVGRRPGHHEKGPGDPPRMALEQVEQHVPSHGHPPDHGPLDRQVIEQGGHIVGQQIHRNAAAGRLAFSESPQVAGNGAITGRRQGGHLCIPHAAAQGKTVNQDDGRTAAGVVPGHGKAVDFRFHETSRVRYEQTLS